MSYVRQGTGSFVIFCVFVASLLAGCESPEDEGEVCEFDGTLRCTLWLLGFWARTLGLSRILLPMEGLLPMESLLHL